MPGIKESKEMLKALNKLSVILIGLFKDGADIGDIATFIGILQKDKNLQQCLKDAYAGYQSIPDEVKDLSYLEMAELAYYQIKQIPEILDAVK